MIDIRKSSLLMFWRCGLELPGWMENKTKCRIVLNIAAITFQTFCYWAYPSTKQVGKEVFPITQQLIAASSQN
jgi:hypothetical protein